MGSGRVQSVRPVPRFIGRDRSQAWWLLVVSAVIAGLWAAVQLVKPSVPLPVQVLVAVVAAVIAVVVPELRVRRRRDDERRRVMACHLRLLPDAGKLPLVEPPPGPRPRPCRAPMTLDDLAFTFSADADSAGTGSSPADMGLGLVIGRSPRRLPALAVITTTEVSTV
jgi:hypothetical protein